MIDQRAEQVETCLVCKVAWDPERMIPAATPVIETRDGRYLVESLSIPGAWRLVTGNTCSCPAGHQQTCRHRRAVRVHQQAAERQRARPTVPVHPALKEN